jgi:hypothetical protein
MRVITALLAVSLTVSLLGPIGGAGSAMADEADDFFEVGLRYLKTGFYPEARAAFSESLVRAPNEAVPTAFTALACAAEGRDSRSCALLVRLAYRRLPAHQKFQLRLDRILGNKSKLDRIEQRFAKRLAGARGAGRIDNLTVLAFLQMHDETPKTSAALKQLQKERPGDSFLKSVAKIHAPAKPAVPKKGPKEEAKKGAKKETETPAGKPANKSADAKASKSG